MKVIVLAAGRSNRMKPIGDKCFLKFVGKPLLQHQLERLHAAGFNDFMVVGGAHNLASIQGLCNSLPFSVAAAEQKDLDTGMAGGILAASDWVNGEPILIVNSNDVVDAEAYTLMQEALADQGEDSFLLAKKVDSYFPGGYVTVNENNLLTGIAEKPGAGNEPSDLVNIVVHFHRDSERLFEALRKVETTKDDRYEVALDGLIQGGVHMKAVRYEGFWQPLKYPWHVLDVMEYFLAGASSKTEGAEVAETAVLKGNVYLEDGVRVLDHATIIGPAYIGKDAVVASQALVRQANVGAKSVVGYATEVARSFVGDDVWTHSNYIGDSVLGNNVSFGAGTVTGNLRFDEGNVAVCIDEEHVSAERNKFGLITGNHVRSGVNTSFMPGVKIGSNVCVGAGIVVNEDIKDNTFVSAKTELVQYENKLDVSKITRGQL